MCSTVRRLYSPMPTMKIGKMMVRKTENQMTKAIGMRMTRRAWRWWVSVRSVQRARGGNGRQEAMLRGVKWMGKSQALRKKSGRHQRRSQGTFETSPVDDGPASAAASESKAHVAFSRWPGPSHAMCGKSLWVLSLTISGSFGVPAPAKGYNTRTQTQCTSCKSKSPHITWAFDEYHACAGGVARGGGAPSSSYGMMNDVWKETVRSPCRLAYVRLERNLRRPRMNTPFGCARSRRTASSSV